MIVWLKIIHISTVAVWMAGLVSLPGLYVQRAHVVDKDALYRLQRMVRFVYVAMISPAAFLAVGSGIGLIFAREVFTPWMAAKLALVGALVVAHTLAGLVIIRLFGEGEVYPVWRFLVATGLVMALMAGVLFLVLAKPDFDFAALLPESMSEPGALKRILEPLNPWATP
ncbi:conserved hypothetical protein [Parvibaculum lavamentivorans DS-1]|uniref:Protoporphyrinogen IX oxidase n=1 Tax=Parvibaculum lavamentivorans (strain DS-1 / DSM 13023 / NCIMB 13966) TaxID=402881 RepID=A7HQK2_PARL1|nr:CopD family protein [Parvibaculum lavamentivorans]ABS62185.1 conserved hypothetical protein [Parvibaculum lavamentivorans DS-1]